MSVLYLTPGQQDGREESHHSDHEGPPGASVLQPYLSTLIESGDFPNLAPLLKNGVPGADDNFERGLAWPLDGISRDLSSA